MSPTTGGAPATANTSTTTNTTAAAAAKNTKCSGDRQRLTTGGGKGTQRERERTQSRSRSSSRDSTHAKEQQRRGSADGDGGDREKGRDREKERRRKGGVGQGSVSHSSYNMSISTLNTHSSTISGDTAGYKRRSKRRPTASNTNAVTTGTANASSAPAASATQPATTTNDSNHDNNPIHNNLNHHDASFSQGQTAVPAPSIPPAPTTFFPNMLAQQHLLFQQQQQYQACLVPPVPTSAIPGGAAPPPMFFPPPAFNPNDPQFLAFVTAFAAAASNVNNQAGVNLPNFYNMGPLPTGTPAVPFSAASAAGDFSPAPQHQNQQQQFTSQNTTGAYPRSPSLPTSFQSEQQREYLQQQMTAQACVPHSFSRSSSLPGLYPQGQLQQQQFSSRDISSNAPFTTYDDNLQQQEQQEQYVVNHNKNDDEYDENQNVDDEQEGQSKGFATSAPNQKTKMLQQKQQQCQKLQSSLHPKEQREQQLRVSSATKTEQGRKLQQQNSTLGQQQQSTQQPQQNKKQEDLIALRPCIQLEANGLRWIIQPDTPAGHCKQRLRIVKGVEYFSDDESDDGKNKEQVNDNGKELRQGEKEKENGTLSAHKREYQGPNCDLVEEKKQEKNDNYQQSSEQNFPSMSAHSLADSIDNSAILPESDVEEELCGTGCDGQQRNFGSNTRPFVNSEIRKNSNSNRKQKPRAFKYTPPSLLQCGSETDEEDEDRFAQPFACANHDFLSPQPKIAVERREIVFEPSDGGSVGKEDEDSSSESHVENSTENDDEEEEKIDVAEEDGPDDDEGGDDGEDYDDGDCEDDGDDDDQNESLEDDDVESEDESESDNHSDSDKSDEDEDTLDEMERPPATSHIGQFMQKAPRKPISEGYEEEQSIDPLANFTPTQQSWENITKQSGRVKPSSDARNSFDSFADQTYQRPLNRVEEEPSSATSASDTFGVFNQKSPESLTKDNNERHRSLSDVDERVQEFELEDEPLGATLNRKLIGKQRCSLEQDRAVVHAYPASAPSSPGSNLQKSLQLQQPSFVPETQQGTTCRGGKRDPSARFTRAKLRRHKSSDDAFAFGSTMSTPDFGVRVKNFRGDHSVQSALVISPTARSKKTLSNESVHSESESSSSAFSFGIPGLKDKMKKPTYTSQRSMGDESIVSTQFLQFNFRADDGLTLIENPDEVDDNLGVPDEPDDVSVNEFNAHDGEEAEDIAWSEIVSTMDDEDPPASSAASRVSFFTSKDDGTGENEKSTRGRSRLGLGLLRNASKRGNMSNQKELELVKRFFTFGNQSVVSSSASLADRGHKLDDDEDDDDDEDY